MDYISYIYLRIKREEVYFKSSLLLSLMILLTVFLISYSFFWHCLKSSS
jgi:hypothetical protein